MKRIVYLALTIVALYGAILSPYGLLTTKQNYDTLVKSLEKYDTAKKQVSISQNALAEAQSVFNGNRTFEIAYSDVSRLYQVLNNVATVTVSSIDIADPEQYFVVGSRWTEDSEAKAISCSLTVNDTVSALKIIDRMELPLYSVTVVEPNMINIVFLTGGGI